MKKEAELVIARSEKELASYDVIITRVRKNMENIAKGYMAIAADIKRINDTRAWEMYEGLEGYADEYNGISSFCYDVFGISQSMCSKLVKIGQEFIDEKYRIKEEWKDYSMSALYMLAAVPEKKRLELPINPGMSQSELRKVAGDAMPTPKRRGSKASVQENVSRETFEETPVEAVEASNPMESEVSYPDSNDPAYIREQRLCMLIDAMEISREYFSEDQIPLFEKFMDMVNKM